MTHTVVMSTLQRTPATPMIPSIGFGDRLRRLRITVGMTQDEFGEAIGLAGATIGKYELIAYEPKTAKLVANSVQLRFGVPAGWLLYGTSAQPTDYARRRLALAA